VAGGFTVIAPANGTGDGGAWSVVIPVKPAEHGKSRLDIPGVDRVALARAIALDTIAAAAACAAVAQVVVVTGDGWMPLHASDISGLRFVPDSDLPGLEPIVAARFASLSRLDAAVARGIASVDARMPRAALLGDLPSLRPADLAEALEAAASVERGVVADVEGTGSTLVTARAAVDWASCFGDGSFARHVALGCVALDVRETSTVRRDVDDAGQLDAAVALGLGERTARVLAGA
jgi:2-phospho-L-lactate guanylyltransferase